MTPLQDDESSEEITRPCTTVSTTVQTAASEKKTLQAKGGWWRGSRICSTRMCLTKAVSLGRAGAESVFAPHDVVVNVQKKADVGCVEHSFTQRIKVSQVEPVQRSTGRLCSGRRKTSGKHNFCANVCRKAVNHEFFPTSVNFT